MAKKTGVDTDVKIGAKIRRLRREGGLTQAALAERLGISASYLNLIEHNKRKVTVGLLLTLADLFDVDLPSLAENDEGQLFVDVMEVLGDDLFEEIDLTNTDARELVTSSPNAGRALLLLYDAYLKAQTDVRSLAARSVADDTEPLHLSAIAPSDQISDMIQDRSNYFDDLEVEAERVGYDIGPLEQRNRATLSAYLKDSLRIDVALAPSGPDFPFLRHYDSERRVLRLSERLTIGSKRFQMAQQIGLVQARPVIDMLLREAHIKDPDALVLGRVALANYFAAALLMPYDRFLESAVEARYDIELLQNRFAAEFEQVCHRLTSLNKPGKAGIPMHMLRVDMAGNVSKRFSLSGLPIPRHGEACSRWNVYAAFLRPGTLTAQLSELPDGSRFFCIAKAIQKGGAINGVDPRYVSIGLGCEGRYAAQMVYADGIGLAPNAPAQPIGVHCRICDRMDCSHRTRAPIHIRAPIDEHIRGISPFTPAEGPAVRRERLPTR